MKKTAVLFVLAVGFFVRLFHLGTYGLSLDEISSVNFAVRGVLYWYLDDTNPPLFHGLLRLWMRFVPPTEFWIRGLSLIFSMGALAFITAACAVADRKHKSLWNYAPAVLLAFLPLAVKNAQEARMGALWELFTALSLWVLVLGRIKTWAVISAAAVSAHWFAGLSQALAGLFMTDLFSRRRRWIAAIALMGAFMGMVAYAMGHAPFQLDWQVHRYQTVPWFVEFPLQLSAVFGHWVNAAILVILLGIRLRGSPKTDSRTGEGAALTVFIYLVGLALLSVLLQRSLFLDRYFAGLAPLVVWALGRALAESPAPSRWRLAGAAVVALGVGSGLVTYFERPQPQWREAFAFLHTQDPVEIWTTRPIATGYPYWDWRDERLHKFAGGGAELERLFQEVQSGRRFAVLENFWGGVIYLEPLKARAQAAGVPLREQVFADRTDEPVKVLIFNP